MYMNMRQLTGTIHFCFTKLFLPRVNGGSFASAVNTSNVMYIETPVC